MDSSVSTDGNNITESLFRCLAGKLAGISIRTCKAALIGYATLLQEPFGTTPEKACSLRSRIDIYYDNPLFHIPWKMLCN